MHRLIREVRVCRRLPLASSTEAFLIAGPTRIRCVLGRSGTRMMKREGDGTTPRGVLGILSGYYRADRIRRPATNFAMHPIRPDDGWCDDPTSFLYNRPVRLPAQIRCERLALDSAVYDIILVTSYNMLPRRMGAGSAIFLHLRRLDGGPTEGCIAFDAADLRRLLPRLSKDVRIRIA
jgi:L,D-peptidoglycan transpeptidase YkuD (ErfK/YbiS/YcfS/YnhG family)